MDEIDSSDATNEDEQDAEDAAAESEPEPEAAAPDPNAKTRAQCTRRKGTFTKTPEGFFVCVRNTGEGQKSCKAASDCKGVCFARSGTCSPLMPLIGCHEILTSSGARATTCLE